MSGRLCFTFIKQGSMDFIAIENDKPEFLGKLEKVRAGKFMTWGLFLNPGCFLTAGCQDEVREKTKELNGKLRTNRSIKRR